MIKGVILDGDGTILDSMGIWDTFAKECLEDLGISDPEFPQSELVSASLRDAARLFISRYSLKLTEDEMLEYFIGKLRSIYAERVEMLPGAPEFLAQLEERGIPAVIATAGDGECVRSVLRRYGLEQTCDGVIDCTSVPVGKSEPAMYDLARQMMHLDKDEVIVFEDALYALRCASRNHYPCVAVCQADDSEYEQKNACALRTIPDYLDMEFFWKLCGDGQNQES